MALVTLPSPILWPGILGQTSGGPTLSGTLVTVSSAGHYGAYVFCAKEDMTISHVGFRAGSAVGSPTAEVRIETLDATGFPSGTLWGTNTNGTTGTVSSSTFVLQALTASASVSKGQIFCVKLAYASGTSLELQQWSSTDYNFQSVLPYGVTNTGTPTKQVMNGSFACMALGSSSTTFYQVPGAVPATNTSVGGAFNNTNSAKRGLRFTPPMSCRVVGIRWYNSTSVGDFNAVIFNDAGTELSSSSTAFDGDFRSTSGNGAQSVFFDSPVTLTAGTTYRAAIEPTTATNVNVSGYTMPSTNYRSASRAGTTAHYTTFATSSWTDTATDQLPFLDIIIDQLDDGTGSGGGVVGVIGG